MNVRSEEIWLFKLSEKGRVNSTSRLIQIGCSSFAKYFFANLAFHQDAAYTRMSAESLLSLKFEGFFRKTWIKTDLRQELAFKRDAYYQYISHRKW
jgi:hypothetical protein